MESGLAGFFHAAPSTLHCIESIQQRFLHESGLTERSALLHYRLAPLCSRRDIATLGLIHRTVLGIGPPAYSGFFRLSQNRIRRITRLQVARHSRQLVDPIIQSSSCLARRSALGMVRCYNALPEFVVRLRTVKDFQRALHHCLCRAALNHVEDWQNLFHKFHLVLGTIAFQGLFNIREDS